jgi:hypothetical protein
MKTNRTTLVAIALAVFAQGALAASNVPRRHLPQAPRTPPVTQPHVPRRHLQQAPRTSSTAIVTAPVTVLCRMLPFLPSCAARP